MVPGDALVHTRSELQRLVESTILRSCVSISKPSFPNLRCADPDGVLPATEEEQVVLVVEVGLVAALLDRKISRDKTEALATSIRLLPGMRRITDEQVNLLLARAGQRTSRSDAWMCEVAHRLTHPGLRRVAFRMAAMFCAWDGIIDDEEQGYLDFLARAFGLDAQEASKLFSEATGHADAFVSMLPPPPDSDAS